MTKEKRQRLLLVVLLVLLVVVAVRAVRQFSGSGGSTAGRRPAAARTAQSGGRPAAGPGSEIVELRLEELAQKPGEFQPGRDPFRFQPKAKPKPPPAPAPAPRQAERKPKPKPERRSQPARPQPPTPDFVFLGSFGPEERRIAVFSDQQEIFNVMEGEVLKEAFVVRKIGYESADIGFVNFPEEPVQRLAAGG